MKTTSHPIDHAIVALMFLFEGLCWIINELAGFHAEPAATFKTKATPIIEAIDEDLDFLNSMTVKELRKAAKGLAKNVSKLRKAELVDLCLHSLQAG